MNRPFKMNSIDYNYLNLPEKVNFGANDNLRYTYDATGNKLTKTVELDGNDEIGNTDYSGNFLYENNELKAIFTSAGRIVPFDNNCEVLKNLNVLLLKQFNNFFNHRIKESCINCCIFRNNKIFIQQEYLV